MQAGNQFRIRSNGATQFREALAVGGFSTIQGVQLTRSAFGHMMLRQLIIQSKENCAWTVIWWGASAETVNPNTDQFMGLWTFNEASGFQTSPGGLWRYIIPELNQPYVDLENINVDGPQYLYLMLGVNPTGANAKSAGDAGEIVITLNVEPTEER